MRVSSILAAIAASMATQATATPVPDEIDALASVAAARVTAMPVLDKTAISGGPKPEGAVFDCDSNWLNPLWTYRLASKCPRMTEDGTETVEWTEIDLNECLMNDMGELKWRRHGLAMKSCRDCVLTDEHTNSPRLSCRCNIGKSNSKMTTISLRDGLYNKDGILHCFDYAGINTSPKRPDAARAAPF
ncbi:uncharacterized protein DNG_00103 [Cephalotrichum gorgonifer]|uniref:Cyanovirin-N domain-containing protein n=1 Tax=Cephalotrichum gorgonifer TaxID=2041049 RepID=A0AAE8MPD6_9PEZI|nr:uncharacterized protein DNG_00103 [Cephalotrichum gorgonifer]